MATGVAIVGAVVSYSQSRKAGTEARRATALSIEQQEQVTAEEIRRQEYTFERDISSIEAEVAGMGISATGEGLRGTRTITPYDSRIAELEGEILPATRNELSDWDGGSVVRLDEIAKDIKSESEELEDLKYKQSREKVAPWNPDSGIFSEYLMERERVHVSEIAWMKKTGLSAVASISAEGRSAQIQTRAMQTAAIGQLAKAGANWWESAQPPVTTTTTLQTG